MPSRSALSPFDVGMVGASSFPVDYAFFFAKPLEPAAMRAALDLVLEHFAPLRSVLVPEGDGAERTVALEEDPRGLSFEAVTVERLPAPTDVPALQALAGSVRSVPGEELTRLRAYASADGGLLTVSVSHVVADGFSSFLFLTAWARSLRGKDFALPLHERTLLEPTERWSHLPTPEEVREVAGVSFTPGRRRSPQVSAYERLSVTAAQLESWRGDDGALSENDVVSAWLWKTLAPRLAANEGHTALSFPCDFRGRFPDFPLGYFGNAVGMRQLRATTDELGRASVAQLGARVRAAVDAYQPTNAQRAAACLDAVRRHGGLEAMESLHLTDPDCGLVVTNLSRVPLKQLDFGQGPPTAVVPLCPSPRLVSLLPGADGGLVAHLCVP